MCTLCDRFTCTCCHPACRAESAFTRIVPSSEAAARHTLTAASPMLAPSSMVVAPFHLACGASTAVTPFHQPVAAPDAVDAWSASCDANAHSHARVPLPADAARPPVDAYNEAMQRGVLAAATGGDAWPPATGAAPAQLLPPQSPVATTGGQHARQQVASVRVSQLPVSARASLTRLAATSESDSTGEGSVVDSEDDL